MLVDFIIGLFSSPKYECVSPYQSIRLTHAYPSDKCKHMNSTTVHTTLNLSKSLMEEAREIFGDKTKTEIIHDALKRMIQSEKLKKHFKKWVGKGAFRSHG